MRKDLQKIHEQLVSVAKESSEIAQRQYNEDDVRKLQNKLQSIDEQYKQGVIDDRDTFNLEDDPYERQGQGQIADELAKVHNTLHMMLTRISK